MRRKFYCPVSGIPRGNKTIKGPYRNVGKYHHRRDLLFVPQWGRKPEQPVSLSPIPMGSTLVWMKDATNAWPLKENPRNEWLYRQNEQRYLAPALRARDKEVKDYLMKQLDPGCRSGIGMFNVRWGPKPIVRRNDPLFAKEIDDLPEGIPKHLVAVLNETYSNVLSKMLQHSVSRQK